MKHGPIALLDAHVPVVSIAMPGQVFEVLSNAQEAKARDAQLIGVASRTRHRPFDDPLPVPEVSEWLSPLLTVVPMQLLSYHIAAHRGLDVDAAQPCEERHGRMTSHDQCVSIRLVDAGLCKVAVQIC